MVDFRKRLTQKTIDRPTDPIAIYERLDRASDKGPLRPAQRAILEEWYAKRRTDRDTILKLHTGQGKTLIGLLMLHSYLNEGKYPVVYVCPNEFLVRQTLEQAAQFGFTCVPVGKGLPPEFLEGKAILVVNVQTLFNGKSRFGLGTQAQKVAAVCLDDAHACVDSIRDAFTMTIWSNEGAYTELRDLFADDLREQGQGTYVDLEGGDSGSFLPVPYWAWREHAESVAIILSKHKDTDSVKFVWPLLRDVLHECRCVVAGNHLQIAPYQPRLQVFATFDAAPVRVFMSATVADDSFLVRGLGLSEESVRDPLRYANERWSGEKMILIPSLIDETLEDAEIVAMFAPPVRDRAIGVVVICPSFGHTARWKVLGAAVAEKRGEVNERVERLLEGDRDDTLIVANRYDGIDLPDDSCRILILDSKPRPDSLLDRYIASVREGSETLIQRTTRAIEQGLGRAVRGEKDFCVILLIGPDLVKFVRTPEGRKFLSAQTRQQIEIGFDVAEMASDEVSDRKSPRDVLRTVLQQSLKRDEGWKEFYLQQMEAVTNATATPKNLAIYAAERRAEELYRNQNIDGAVKALQKLVDGSTSESDQGWYLQEMARYLYVASKIESNRAQIAAHAANSMLLKPQTGMQVRRISAVSEDRASRILESIRQHANYEELAVTVADILSRLRFGVNAEEFERALAKLGEMLGFVTQRPDKQFKAGPDVVWALGGTAFILFEAKSEVSKTRAEIHKSETGQMNNSCAWFAENYPNANAVHRMIINARKLATGAGFNEDVKIMREKHLNALTKSVKAFFAEFRNLDFTALAANHVQQRLTTHKLTGKDLMSAVYSDPPL